MTTLVKLVFVFLSVQCLYAEDSGLSDDARKALEIRKQKIANAKPSLPYEERYKGPSAEEVANTQLKTSILESKGRWTRVPVGSILNIPEFYQSYVVDSSVGEFMQFQLFCKANRGLVKVFNVSKDILHGTEKLSSAEVKKIQESQHITILAHGDNPVVTSLDLLKTK